MSETLGDVLFCWLLLNWQDCVVELEGLLLGREFYRRRNRERNHCILPVIPTVNRFTKPILSYVVKSFWSK